ncbi:MAG: metallophosphoesterase [Bacteroidia bacterium]|nr:metallophosphoesterase [Bacteroidia bacterium]
MRNSGFIIFFSIALTVYFFINLYIYHRGLQAVQYYPGLKPWFIVAFLVFASAYIIGRVTEKYLPSGVGDTIIYAGSFWLGAMLYFFLAVVLLDLARVVNHFLPYFPSFFTDNYPKSRFVAGLVTFIIVTVLLLAGHINAVHPRITKLNIEVHKKAAGLQGLNIAMISDVHLGTIIGKSRLEKIVSVINSLNPDVVIIAGDMFDEDISSVISANVCEPLDNIRSRLGVYFIPGNHDYFGGVDVALNYLKSHHIIILRDSVAVLDGGIYLAGRDDRSANRFTNHNRKPLNELLQGSDTGKPLILLDHQPFALNEAMKCGVDLQLSGHTHHGQLFPVNLITKMIYDLSWGYEKIGNTHFYVSCGVGTWGPPVRIGSFSEIVNIKLVFDD